MSAVRSTLLAGLALVILLCGVHENTTAAEVRPSDTVRSGIADLASAARAHAVGSSESGRDLFEDIRAFLLEYTDVPAAARVILANHWSDAEESQRRRFEAAFNQHVASLLVDLVPHVDFESVSIEPVEGSLEETPLTIDATFRTRDETPIRFVLVMHVRDGEWRIFDVIAEGISYVKTFRTQFNREIADTELETTIARLERRNDD